MRGEEHRYAARGLLAHASGGVFGVLRGVVAGDGSERDGRAKAVGELCDDPLDMLDVGAVHADEEEERATGVGVALQQGGERDGVAGDDVLK